MSILIVNHYTVVLTTLKQTWGPVFQDKFELKEKSKQIF